jgi:hypothetical protein
MNPIAVPAEIASAIEDFFATRTQGPWVVSTAHAVRRIREQLTHCTFDDRELERFVADYAVAHGFNVSFDLGERAG